MSHLVGPHGPIAVLICLLGPFEILKRGKLVSLRSGGKAERLFSCLALHPHAGVHRETLIEHIWPDASLALASQCLNTLMHSLKAQLADALAGQPPIVHAGSHYALNLDGGLGVDVLEFESAVDAGHRLPSVPRPRPSSRMNTPSFFTGATSLQVQIFAGCWNASGYAQSALQRWPASPTRTSNSRTMSRRCTALFGCSRLTHAARMHTEWPCAHTSDWGCELRHCGNTTCAEQSSTTSSMPCRNRPPIGSFSWFVPILGCSERDPVCSRVEPNGPHRNLIGISVTVHR